jgi:hypothetical protein
MYLHGSEQGTISDRTMICLSWVKLLWTRRCLARQLAFLTKPRPVRQVPHAAQAPPGG